MRFTSTLTLIFIVLKSLGLIAWTWWWVFSPIWISLLIIIFIAIIAVVMAEND